LIERDHRSRRVADATNAFGGKTGRARYRDDQAPAGAPQEPRDVVVIVDTRHHLVFGTRLRNGSAQ
jgi:hypothetical protein